MLFFGERFSLIEAKQVREKLKEEKKKHEKIPPDVKKIIRQPDPPGENIDSTGGLSKIEANRVLRS